ncbi:hypothetical protein [Sphaerothrix gracilis]|uniref:hypothetical protein n=1 Tax=Sphaerothrix gracilis TaxID=3151835 RepID=UPI0031FDAAFC
MKKPAQTIGSGCLLLMGLFFVALFIAVALDPENAGDRANILAAAVVFGGPPLIAGGWLAWHLRRQEQQAKAAEAEALQVQLQQIFFQLVAENSGSLSVLQFARATGMSGTEARAYLDDRAQEFGADFSVGEQGEFFYQFPSR